MASSTTTPSPAESACAAQRTKPQRLRGRRLPRPILCALDAVASPWSYFADARRWARLASLHTLTSHPTPNAFAHTGVPSSRRKDHSPSAPPAVAGQPWRAYARAKYGPGKKPKCRATGLTISVRSWREVAGRLLLTLGAFSQISPDRSARVRSLSTRCSAGSRYAARGTRGARSMQGAERTRGSRRARSIRGAEHTSGRTYNGQNGHKG